MLEVVSAVIIAKGRILLTQRRHDKDFPYAWESPGGKVEGDESHHEALRRECDEEIGVTLGPIPEQAFWCHEFHGLVERRERGNVFVLFYRATVARDAERPRSGAPTPREGQGIGWFTAEEMRGLTLAPANKMAIDLVAELLKRSL